MTYRLSPEGGHSVHGPQHLAVVRGLLNGALVDGAVRTWLERDDRLILLVWPREFRANIDPLELLDENGQVLARGGERIAVGGGSFPEETTVRGSTRSFHAWSVSRETETSDHSATASDS